MVLSGIIGQWGNISTIHKNDVLETLTLPSTDESAQNGNDSQTFDDLFPAKWFPIIYSPNRASFCKNANKGRLWRTQTTPFLWIMRMNLSFSLLT